MIARWVPVLFGLAVLGGCAGGPSLPLCQTEVSAEEVVEGYRLGPGDRVRLTVFRHPDLSGEFALDGQGTLSLPLIGDFPANGVTTRKLQADVEQRFREQSYLVEPRVSIAVLTYRPFYILGEVARPGEYEYQNGLTVGRAVALAGGFSYRADQSDIYIRRGDCMRQANTGTEVLPGEIVQVPERFF